eukprot:SM000067S20295  [mRNA]  locus=s67:149194:149827:+ [translate_table: standard]
MTSGALARAVVRARQLAHAEALRAQQALAVQAAPLLRHGSRRLARLHKLVQANFQKETSASGQPLKQTKKEKQQAQRQIWEEAAQLA